MPKVTLKFDSADAIPAELKAFAKADSTSIDVWAGDNVAGETNPGLEANKNTILSEKTKLQTKYDDLLRSSGETASEVLELRSKLASQSGEKVTADDLALLSAVKAVNPQIKPDALKKELEALPTIRAELDTLKSTEINRAIFAASGFKNEKVFMDLIGNKTKNPNLDKVAVEAETVDGKTVNKVFAHVKNADGTLVKTALDEYVKSNAEWQDYLPVLNAGGQSNGQPWLPQDNAASGDKGSGQSSVLDDFINKTNEKNAAKPNPLRPNVVEPPKGVNANVPQN